MRKQILYAPRVRGDLGLGLEPSRLGGDGNKAWARMDFPGMRIAGQADQLVTVAVDTQRFEIGTRRIEYGRTFRYSLAAEDITEATHARLVANGNFAPGVIAAPYGVVANRDGYNGAPYAQAEIGQSYIDIDLIGRAVNFFQGSYLQTLPAADPICQHYIVASDVSTATYTRVYLDHPLIMVVTLAMYIGICASPYTRIINGDAALAAARYVSFVGLPLVNPTDGQYFWLQTAGPAWIQPTGWADERLPGRGENYRDVYAAVDGSIMSTFTRGLVTDGYQRVGYLLDATYVDYGSVFIMLQLE